MLICSPFQFANLQMLAIIPAGANELCVRCLSFCSMFETHVKLFRTTSQSGFPAESACRYSNEAHGYDLQIGDRC